MAIERCESNGHPGWRNGPDGTCHTYDEKAPGGSTVAKAKALKESVGKAVGRQNHDGQVQI